MSLSTLNQKSIRLNIINKQSPTLKISLIAGTTLTISHLKRKIQTEYSQLYNIQLVIKSIEDINGFTISNNSTVDEHFKNGDTVYFDTHHEAEKTGNGMKLVNNLGEILSTVRFMTASALEKMDRIDLGVANVMEIVPDIMHIAFWYNNPTIVQKLLKILNKIFSESSIETFLSQISQLQLSLFLRIFTFWLCDTIAPLQNSLQISWQLLQLLQKLTMNIKFVTIIKNHKLNKNILEFSKDGNVSNQVKKICVRIGRNVNGGSKGGGGFGKVRSEYVPSMLMGSNVGGFGVQEVLEGLASGSQDQKISALQQLSQNNYLFLQQATIRSSYYQKLLNLFTIRKLKTKKHQNMLLECITKLSQNTNKDQCIETVQKDIFKKIHSFLLQMPVQLHAVVIQYFGKICKVSALSGMFNIQKGVELLKSPYQGVVKVVVNGLLTMSQKINNTSSIRFIPGIRDYITLSLKTQSQPLSLNLLKLLSNLSLDEQCRYQILNLKGIEVFVKFLQTCQNQQICRICAKGLLNLAISSRENKAKVIGAMNGIIERYYRGEYDGVTHGFVETVLKSKNM